MTSSDFSELIAKARRGDEDALGKLVERYRRYLCSLANSQLDTAVERRLDPSDVVQQTCLEFYRDFHTFRGAEEAELQACLKQLVQRNVSTGRRQGVASGDVARSAPGSSRLPADGRGRMWMAYGRRDAGGPPSILARHG